MRSPRIATGMAILWLGLLASPGGAIDIRPLHRNTSSGVPNKSGFRFDVAGLVTMPDGVRSLTNTEVAIQDSSGGIVLFHSGGLPGATFNLGDSVSVQGLLTHFNGLAELTTLSNFVKLSTGNPLPEPLVLTCNQVATSFLVSSPDSFPDYNEGRLIRIDNVTVVAGAWPSPCAGANVSLTIQDASGTCLLFIDKDSQVCGSPNPSGPFDVIGILSQFDNAAPHTAGYEIVPRYLTDIIPITPGPIFLTNPQAVDIDSTSARIVWDTDVASTSLVEYGFTTSYGTMEGDSTPVTSHDVQLTGLTPGKLYHFRVASTDAFGTRLSGDFTFVTPSTAPGQMNFYFSHSIDPLYASPDIAQGNVDLSLPVINRIDAASHDISVALYTFNKVAVADALISAWNRGVLVRLIIDADVSQTQADRLRVEGIPVITSTYGGNHGTGIQHNKFFVIDARDLTSSTDDWVWTGSANMTNENLADMNNGVEIQDAGLAAAYLLEFNEMWGSSTDAPSAALAKMGSSKTDNTPHSFTIGGVPVESYFSPSDGTENQIVSEMNAADENIYICINVFTSDPISNAMKAKHDGVPGFAVRGVFDTGNSGQSGSEWPNLSGTGGSNPWSPPADVWLDAEPNDLHHKYGIVDAGLPDDGPTVITGSHNWSNAANTVNDENTLIFHDHNIASLYLQEFAERYHNAGGSGDLVPVGVGDKMLASGLRLSAPWPNPVRETGLVEYVVPGPVAAGQRVTLRLYDARGRLVRSLVDGPAVAGSHRAVFDGLDSGGVRLASGVYLLELDALGQQLTQKWVSVR